VVVMSRMDYWKARKSTVTVLYSYVYDNRHQRVCISEGERLILIEKTNSDWWQVRRPGDTKPFYAPATYLQEDGVKTRNKFSSSSSSFSSSPSKETAVVPSSYTSKIRLIKKDPELPLTASKSDDALPPLPPPPPSSCRNAQLRKQRSTSMDAIMFLELLEDEIKDMPTCALKSDARDVAVLGTAAASKSSKIDDKFKKPRISKDVWERRKSWAVEESGPTSSTPSTSPVKPRALKRVDEGGGGGAPPLPPRSGPSAESAHRPTDKRADDKTLSKSDVIKFDNPTTDRDKTTSVTPAATPPALPPKKISAPSAPQFNSNWKSSGEKSKNYSKVTPLRLIPPEGSGSAEAIQIARALSASLEKLNQQIHKNSMDASAAVKLKGCTHPDKAPEAPELPPKKVSATSSLKPAVAKRSIDRLKKKEKENGVVGADNYVNLLRPLTIVDSVEDIHSDESGINMSFNNPLFLPKHSSTEEKASSTKTKRNSLSSSEMDGNEAISSSGEDILSSKDSLNSIPSTKSERARCRKSEADVPEVGQLRPQRKLFENWVEYVDPSSGRLFYYNEQSRQRSWKPPRRRGSSSPTNQPEERDGDGDDPAEGGVRSRLHAVAEAARNRTLPPVPAGWNESIDPYTEEVFYTSSATGARWYTSLDAKGRIYFYEEDSNESVWALPHITPAPPTFNDAVVEGIQLKGVYYPEGSKLSPSMNAPSRSVIPIVGPPKWDVLRQKSFKEVSKGDRQSKTRSMVLTNFSGCVEDVAVEEGGLVAGVAVAGVRTMTPMKTASLPRRIDIVYGTEAPQWPTLQAGSIVSDYISNLHIVSHGLFISFSSFLRCDVLVRCFHVHKNIANRRRRPFRDPSDPSDPSDPLRGLFPVKVP